MKVWLISSLFAGFAFWQCWFTPDQQGDRLMADERFAEAAEVYRDPMRQGVAWFRAGEFKKAGQVFARVPTAEGEFNRGNAFVFQGLYEDAVRRYDRALELHPDWEDAEVNRSIAVARAEAIKTEGGEMGDQTIGADKIVFDKTKKGGQETRIDPTKASNDQGTQALWLRKMQTDPADFLRAKFSYQSVMSGEVEP